MTGGSVVEKYEEEYNGHRLVYVLFQQSRQIGIIAIMDEDEFAVQSDIALRLPIVKNIFHRITKGKVYPAQLQDVVYDLMIDLAP